ncbi:MAG: hypothetical protein ACE5K7_05920, partial [Phycisphaerae bacterium]
EVQACRETEADEAFGPIDQGAVLAAGADEGSTPVEQDGLNIDGHELTCQRILGGSFYLAGLDGQPGVVVVGAGAMAGC